jgi:peptidoglycan L-alanyl-D-glutamate endopeptidase CwlK
MSGHIFPEDILFLQRLLSCCGLYDGKLDGVWGPKTDAAEKAFGQKCDSIASTIGKLDDRSERSIRTLQTDVQQLCRESIRRMRAAGFDARVISGTRTYAEQAELFRRGRFGDPAPRVTNARAGQSWHNFGRAWDVGIFKGSKYLTEGPEYAQASMHGKIDGVEWGGDWVSFKDKPHYQVTGQTSGLSAMRTLFESGGR